MAAPRIEQKSALMPPVDAVVETLAGIVTPVLVAVGAFAYVQGRRNRSHSSAERDGDLR